MKRLLLLGVIALASCRVDVTTIGSIGAWTVIDSPDKFRHFRALWVDGQDRPYTLGVPKWVPPPPDDAGDAADDAGGDDSPPVEAGEDAVVPFEAAIDSSMPDALTFDTSVPDAMPDLQFPIKSALLRRDDTGWTDVRDLPMVANAVWANDPSSACVAGTDAFACGPGFALEQPTEWADFTAVWAVDVDHVWFGGTSMVEKRSGARVETVLDPADRVLAIWGASSSDVWAVSEASVIRHWDGVAWRSQPSGVEYSLRAVWGSGPRDIWAVGDGGTVLHFDGSTWWFLESGTPSDLAGVSGTSKDDVWIVGNDGTILHWNGDSLGAFPSPTKENLTAVVAKSAESAWAVGPRVILRFSR